ncbi:MAG: branched-chain amino acid ABC transporter permease [Actinobacteria bacterium]|jgi:branched-chain amino acid transport system permease protein|nr:branched-chain amino acid ABC transporter permease [Actinomycetota bacterium]MBU1494129.1 branched-chain amino acid ABC transporter permease [Actinomycetota bacterium]MBU1865510.1 branched-chain amino acid ABC transporter permease [Actinomycetota bacterium]
MRNRPALIGDYRSDAVVFRSGVQRVWMGLLLVAAVFLTFGGSLGPIRLEGEWVVLAATAVFASIGAIGLNVVTGMAGQVSLGHAFFLGMGAFTAAVLGGVEGTAPALDPVTGELIQKVVLAGYQLDMLIWLPAAGLVAALAGFIVAPVATRLRGLYLAFVTLGLVFIGDHIFREAEYFTGGAFVGRAPAEMSLLGFRFDKPGEVFGVFLGKNQKLLLLGVVLLVVMGLAAKNLFRSKVGRAMAAVRDRDIAAEIMGIGLARTKTIAFVISSFYAGIAGALLYAVVGRLQPEGFGFALSIDYIAMILIGGVATVSGAIMGAFFLKMVLPKVVVWLAGLPLVDLVISPEVGRGVFDTHQFERILFGLLIIGFLIFEPLGLYGIWIRIRNYWKAWPFSY